MDASMPADLLKSLDNEVNLIEQAEAIYWNWSGVCQVGTFLLCAG
jgi:hypothetical protein